MDEYQLYEIDYHKQEFESSDIDIMFGDKRVRWYQYVGVRLVEDAFINLWCRRVCLCSPTGSGKTTNCGMVFNSPAIREWVGLSNETDENGTYKEKLRILFLAHKYRLLTQAERAYADMTGVEIIYQSIFTPVHPSLVERGWHLTVADEVQHEAMSSFQYQLETYTESTDNHLGFIPFIGLTATYLRADGLLIKMDKIIEPITREQAVEEGWLPKTHIRSFVDPTRATNKTKIITDILRDYHSIMGRTMIFVRTKQEVNEVTEWMINNLPQYVTCGIADQSNEELDFILDLMELGEVDFVINCNKISEGVDIQSCDTVFIGKQVGSLVMLNQIIGRARSSKTKEALLIELINPLRENNLDSTCIVGVPESHQLIFKRGGKWKEMEFDYSTEDYELDHTDEIM